MLIELVKLYTLSLFLNNSINTNEKFKKYKLKLTFLKKNYSKPSVLGRLCKLNNT